MNSSENDDSSAPTEGEWVSVAAELTVIATGVCPIIILIGALYAYYSKNNEIDSLEENLPEVASLSAADFDSQDNDNDDDDDEIKISESTPTVDMILHTNSTSAVEIMLDIDNSDLLYDSRLPEIDTCSNIQIEIEPDNATKPSNPITLIGFFSKIVSTVCGSKTPVINKEEQENLLTNSF